MTSSSTSATTRTGTTSPPRDIARQWSVLVSAVVAVAVSFLGSGAVVGTPVNQVADGALSSSATLVAPAGPAFAIWGVIYTGLLLLALLQVLPSRRTDPRQRRTGWWTAVSLLLNAVWILVIQVEQIVAAFAVIAALAAVLVVAMVRLDERPAATAYERLVVDGTLGLYLGWVCIATVANAAAALVVLGVDPVGTAAVSWAVLVLVVAGAIGVLLAVGLGGRIAPALSLAWGLVWVAVARTTGEPTSTAVATTAVLAAVVTLASAVVIAARRRGRHTVG
jgi:MFS family permease